MRFDSDVYNLKQNVFIFLETEALKALKCKDYFHNCHIKVHVFKLAFRLQLNYM